MIYLTMIGIEPFDIDGSKRLRKLLKYFKPELILMPNSYPAYKSNRYNTIKLNEDIISELNLWKENFPDSNEKTLDEFLGNRFYKDTEVMRYSKRNDTPIIFLNIEEENPSKNSLDQTVEKILRASPEVAKAIIEKEYSQIGKQLDEKVKGEYKRRDAVLIKKLSGIIQGNKVFVYKLSEVTNTIHKSEIGKLKGNIILIGSAGYIFGDYKPTRYKELKAELKKAGIKKVNRIKLNEADKPLYDV